MGKSSDIISIGVSRKSEGTIVLKEIVVVFIVLSGTAYGFELERGCLFRRNTLVGVTTIGDRGS